MKLKFTLVIGLFVSILSLNAQVAHPPQNRGAEGMFYWNESLQKYVRSDEAQIDFSKYYSMFPKGNISVVSYLTGKTFKKRPNGTGTDYTSIYFVGMDSLTDKPFDYNPYPNAKDYAGSPIDFAPNRMKMLLKTDKNICDTFYVFDVSFQQNGAAIIKFYFRKGTYRYDKYWGAPVKSLYLFLQNADANGGIESYLGGTPNGMYRLENDYVYNKQVQTATASATATEPSNTIPYNKTEKYKNKTLGGKILQFFWEVLKALFMPQ